jgi:hypothetical protein
MHSLLVSHGNACGFYTAVECHKQFNEHAPAHEYLNTTLTLGAKHPGFGKQVHTAHATASPLTSLDGGKTWKVAVFSTSVDSIRADHNAGCAYCYRCFALRCGGKFNDGK